MKPTLADLTASPRSDILDGYKLSPFTLTDFGQAEAEFSRFHLAVAGAASEALSDKAGAMVIRAATEDVVQRRFAVGAEGFRRAAFDTSNLPYLLWLSLQSHHSGVTRDEAEAMLNDANEASVHTGVLQLMGYTFGVEPDEKKGRAARSTGMESSPPSDTATSAMSTSGA